MLVNNMTNEALNIPQLLKEHDVARITGLSVATVRRWRLFKQGPKYVKVGAAVRYHPEDVRRWLNSLPSGGSGGQPLDA